VSAAADADAAVDAAAAVFAQAASVSLDSPPRVAHQQDSGHLVLVNAMSSGCGHRTQGRLSERNADVAVEVAAAQLAVSQVSNAASSLVLVVSWPHPVLLLVGAEKLFAMLALAVAAPTWERVPLR